MTGKDKTKTNPEPEPGATYAPSEPYTFSEEALAYTPSVSALADAERYFLFDREARTEPWSRGRKRTDLEVDAAVDEAIRETEKRLIRLQCLRRLRLEQRKDRTWLQRVLGVRR